MTEALAPGAVIGILGGGQLGRMLSVAAARLGLKSHIFEPGANPPAGQLADAVTTAGYDDVDALRAFAGSVDVITYEFENIPTAALDLGGREELVASLGELATDSTTPPTVLVTHHVEEIPASFTHVLLLKEGRVLTAGPIDDELNAESLSECFGLPVLLERYGDRWTARGR